MKFRFLLAVLILTACSSAAKSRPSSEKDNLLQAQTFAGDFENENVKPFELVLVLGAMAFPIGLICFYELCRSAPMRCINPVGTFFPLRAANGSQASHDIGFFHSVDCKRIL
jgi:hypothetical protein